ncbi:major facilitator superfamily domain-containing protein [Penicillium malachiteum]|nr:major facilitator superfamily domain-containing protein [Penicillium malachiteum]
MVWWWMAIFFGICFCAFLFLYEESMYKVSAGVIDGIPTSDGNPAMPAIDSTEKNQERLPDSIRKFTADNTNAETETTAPQIDDTIPNKTYLQRLVPFSRPQGSPNHFMRHCYQPFLILFIIPSVFFMALIYGAMTACTTIMVTTLSSYMALPPYNFDSAQIGLMRPVIDWAIIFLARRNKGIYEPEMRLWVIAAFIPLVPAGILMFGISLNMGSPWPLLAVGFALCAFGNAPASSVSLTYITDAYGEIVADALVAVSFVRNLFATALVFSLTPWIESVGLANVFITIAVLMTVVLLGTFGFILYGKRLRHLVAGRYQYFAGRQMDLRQ